MIVFLKKYIFNFWVWWYWFNAKEVLLKFKSDWLFTLGSLNLIPMIKSLFAPLYQDDSWTGRIVAFPIRFFWMLYGLIVISIFTVILIIAFSLYLLLPLFPLFVIVNTLING